ncbi:group II truncated hemoglobin [Mesorhizobium sp. BR1-1-16]|uniref:group II truncated hemoglobin n=1 Tax=Mesorhizobium sp. BR1-1-16 TaxID=2876653 RepID=UPI001CCED5EB|nr:group II truncated hemoglobin [Mesorhizobium sp. BR1-1-16]MBZ9939057.1 group II truncated hemoglobin [Mesorhizobium sp. BR1-1-16]
MESADTIPTLVDWAGGVEPFRRLTALFYAKVPKDAILGPIFAGMDPHHAEHVAAFVAEVLGGPPDYTASGGSHRAMIVRHMGRHLTETQRRRWIDMMLDTLDEAGLPADPEFRAAVVGYLEWGTRLAVINSADGAVPPPEGAPMPGWNWGPPGGPYRG